MNILLNWKEEYSVAIKELDQQHKKLFDLINLLYDSYIRKENDDVVEEILLDLKDYAFVHFRDEEKYFTEEKLLEHDECQAHFSQHHYFISQINKFQSKYKSHDPSLQYEMILFLQEWITNHIMKSDKKYMDQMMKRR